MCEQRSLLSFEASYTLDILSFLDLLYRDDLSNHVEIVTHFEELLSPECYKLVKNARKKLPQHQTFISLLIPLITADSEFNHLKLSELLSSPKYLVTQVKKHQNYKQLSKEVKKSIKKDAIGIISQLAIVMTQLEKAKFKAFWIEERLALIKPKIRQHETQVLPIQLIEHLNEWLSQNNEAPCKVYLLSFYEGDSVQLFNQDLMTSINNSSISLIQTLIDQILSTVEIEHELKLLIKQLKNNQDFIRGYQAVKGEYKQMTPYLEKNIKLAIMTYFYHQFNVLDQPYEYLSRYNFGTHKLAVVFYHYLKFHPKKAQQTFSDYLSLMFKEIDFQSFEQQALNLLNQQA